MNKSIIEKLKKAHKNSKEIISRLDKFEEKLNLGIINLNIASEEIQKEINKYKYK
jgi:hypothetical protein